MATPNPLELTMFPVMWKSLVDYINGMFTTFVPGGEVYEVAIISFMIAYAIKTRNKWKTTSLVVFTVVIYTSLRYFGFGNKT